MLSCNKPHSPIHSQNFFFINIHNLTVSWIHQTQLRVQYLAQGNFKLQIRGPRGSNSDLLTLLYHLSSPHHIWHLLSTSMKIVAVSLACCLLWLAHLEKPEEVNWLTFFWLYQFTYIKGCVISFTTLILLHYYQSCQWLIISPPI